MQDARPPLSPGDGTLGRLELGHPIWPIPVIVWILANGRVPGIWRAEEREIVG